MKSSLMLAACAVMLACTKEQTATPIPPNPAPQGLCGFIDTPPSDGSNLWHFELMDYLTEWESVDWTVNGLPEGTGGGMNAVLLPGNTYYVKATITYPDTVTYCEETIVVPN